MGRGMLASVSTMNPCIAIRERESMRVDLSIVYERPRNRTHRVEHDNSDSYRSKAAQYEFIPSPNDIDPSQESDYKVN